MHQIKILLSFIRYFFRADTFYQVHSPFVYELAQNILEDEREYYAFTDVEKLRFDLHQNHEKIQLTDFGAGSKSNSSQQKSISQIAKSAASQKWQCQTLFRLVNYIKPKTMLELGTSLGISTIYQASASLNANFITLEGDPTIAGFAQFHFQEFKLKNVESQVGKFEKTLQPALEKLKQLDYVFIDGNHRMKPTLSYFETCLKYAHNETVFVFDDIHWSEEMESTWEKIKAHPQVTVTVDVFHMGIVFIRKEQKEKEHFTLAPLSWKPWASTRTFFK